MKEKMNECKQNQNAGFTLLELLIAMLMTLIIVTTIGQFMATTSRTYQILDNQINLQTEVQCTTNMIADMILEGNNVVFDKTNKMLRIYKNLGTKYSGQQSRTLSGIMRKITICICLSVKVEQIMIMLMRIRMVN